MGSKFLDFLSSVYNSYERIITDNKLQKYVLAKILAFMQVSVM